MFEADAPPALVEREAELASIAARLRRAREGVGGVTVIEGPAGIGKTSLLQVLRDEAERAGMRVLHARGAELEREFAFGVLRQLLEPALASLDPTDRARVTAGHAAHATAIFEPGPADATKAAILHGLFWLVSNLGELGPLALIVDNAQWADRSSIEALGFVTRRVEHLPLALVVATRPPDVDTQPELVTLLADPAAEVLRPAPLGVAAIAALSGSEDADFLAAAADATGGNPFLVDQLLRELGTERSAAAVHGARPRELARTVLAGLGEDARSLARAMAILGDDGGLAAGAALAGIKDVQAAADELARAGITADTGHGFRHPLLAAAVESELGAAKRGSWHAGAAAQLRASGADAERIALHLLKAPPEGDAETARTLHQAAAAARRRGAPDVAAALLRRARAEPPAEEDRMPVAFELGRTLAALGQPEGAEILLEVSRTASDPIMRAEALKARAWITGSRAAGVDPREVGTVIDALPPDAHLLRLQLEALQTAESDPRRLGALLERADALGWFDEDFDEKSNLLAYFARWNARAGQPAAVCAPIAERAARAAIADPDMLPTGLGLFMTLRVLRQAEHFEPAFELLEAMEQRVLERGLPATFSLLRFWRSNFERDAGLLIDAHASAASAVDTADAAEAVTWIRTLATSSLIDVLVERGQLPDAKTALETLQLGESVPGERPFGVFLVSRGSLRHELGELRASQRDLEEAERRLATFGPASLNGQEGRLRRALILLATGDSSRARELAEQAVEIAERWAAPGAIGAALRVKGLVLGDLETLRAAAASLARSPLRAQYARALADVGAALRRTNARAAARDPLRNALEIARDSGADGLAERLEHELQATGARVPARPGGGAAALTPSEQRIACMAADGMSNKDIAQALFVTVKTVEMHLGNSYRKLDVNSRRDLRDALAR